MWNDKSFNIWISRRKTLWVKIQGSKGRGWAGKLANKKLFHRIRIAFLKQELKTLWVFADIRTVLKVANDIKNSWFKIFISYILIK